MTTYASWTCWGFRVCFIFSIFCFKSDLCTSHMNSETRDGSNKRIPQYVHRRIRSLMKCHPAGLQEAEFEQAYFAKFNEKFSYDSMDCNISTISVKFRMMIRREIDADGKTWLLPGKSLIPSRQRRTGSTVYPNITMTSKKGDLHPQRTRLHRRLNTAQFTPDMTAIIGKLKARKGTSKRRESLHALLAPQDMVDGDDDVSPPKPAAKVSPAHAPAPAAAAAHSWTGVAEDNWRTRGWADSSESSPPADAPPFSHRPPPLPPAPRPLQLRGGCASAAPENAAGAPAGGEPAGGGGGLSGGEEARVAGLSRALARALLAGVQVRRSGPCAGRPGPGPARARPGP
jgi:hypothetical protein